MPRFALTIAYDGTHFHGWQKQEPPDAEPLRTVQGVVEETVRTIVREPIQLGGASRTDSGVHAIGQTAAYTCENDFPVEKLARALNGRLPDDVQVTRAVIAPDDFDPIGHCTSKGYRYSIKHSVRNDVRAPLFDRHQIFWTAYELDVDVMQDAAAVLVGEHDFACLTRLDHGRESTVRTIHECTVVEDGPHHCHIDVSGNGFLYNMVRIIAGTLIEVGRGRMSVEDVRTMLENNDREASGPTVPPHGLCLMWIEYEPDPFGPRTD